MRQIGLATHNYESTHQTLPMAVGLPGQNANGKRLSGLATLLPFMDSSPLFEQITNPSEFNGVAYPAMGPAFSDQSYPPWTDQNPMLVCPSDEVSKGPFGRTNYAFSIGDTARKIYQPEKLRGPFGCFKSATFNDVSDGTSNTIALTEIGAVRIDTTRGGFITGGKQQWLDKPDEVFSKVDQASGKYKSKKGLAGRGSHWASGSAGISLVNTILPPGSPSFMVSGSLNGDGIYSAGSGHHRGMNVVLVDDSTHFISDDIDAGDPSTATLTVEQIESEDGASSPHGVWGAMGSMAGGEVVDQNQF